MKNRIVTLFFLCLMPFGLSTSQLPHWHEFKNTQPSSMADYLVELGEKCNEKSTDACFRIGEFFHLNGASLQPAYEDREIAAHYFKQSCDLGNGDACNYFAGISFEKYRETGFGDSDEEYQYYLKGCELGALGGCYAAALAMYNNREQYRDIRPEKLKIADLSDVIRLLSKACEGQHVVACRTLDQSYIHFAEKASRDESSSMVSKLNADCDNETGSSCFFLGKLLWQGHVSDFDVDGITLNWVERKQYANKLMEKACNLNFMPACG